MDADTEDKKSLFSKDEIYQLEMQVSILQKRVEMQQKKPRDAIREQVEARHGMACHCECDVETAKLSGDEKVCPAAGYPFS